MTQPPSSNTKDQESVSDELARDMEEALSGEFELQLVWMKATGKTREEARAAFHAAKARAVADLVRKTVLTEAMKRAAANCICEEFRFQEARCAELKSTRAELRSTPGRHHAAGCPQRKD